MRIELLKKWLGAVWFRWVNLGDIIDTNLRDIYSICNLTGCLQHSIIRLPNGVIKGGGYQVVRVTNLCSQRGGNLRGLTVRRKQSLHKSGF